MSVIWPLSGAKHINRATAEQARFYEYAPFCNGAGNVKSRRVSLKP